MNLPPSFNEEDDDVNFENLVSPDINNRSWQIACITVFAIFLLSILLAIAVLAVRMLFFS